MTLTQALPLIGLLIVAVIFIVYRIQARLALNSAREQLRQSQEAERQEMDQLIKKLREETTRKKDAYEQALDEYRRKFPAGDGNNDAG